MIEVTGAPPRFDPMENKLMALNPGQQLFLEASSFPFISQHINFPSAGCWSEHCHTRGCPLEKFFPPVPVNASVLDKNHQQFSLSNETKKLHINTNFSGNTEGNQKISKSSPYNLP